MARTKEFSSRAIVERKPKQINKIEVPGSYLILPRDTSVEVPDFGLEIREKLRQQFPAMFFLSDSLLLEEEGIEPKGRGGKRTVPILHEPLVSESGEIFALSYVSYGEEGDESGLINRFALRGNGEKFVFRVDKGKTLPWTGRLRWVLGEGRLVRTAIDILNERLQSEKLEVFVEK